MKKLLIPSIIAGALASTSVFADSNSGALAISQVAPENNSGPFILYKSGKDQLSMLGYLHVALNNESEANSNTDPKLTSGSSMLGLDYVQYLQNNWLFNAHSAWGFDFLNQNTGDDSDPMFTNDESYIAFKHHSDNWDTGISAGKRYGVYYDVVSGTDMYNSFDQVGSGVYSNNSNGAGFGTGEADGVIQWRNDFGPVSFALQYATAHTNQEQFGALTNSSTDAQGNIKHGYGVNIMGHLDIGTGLNFGVAYNQAQVDEINVAGTTVNNGAVSNGELTPKAQAIGVQYGQWGRGKGWYAAANYGVYRNQENFAGWTGYVTANNTIYDKAQGMDAKVAYSFANGIRLLGGYDTLRQDTAGDAAKIQYAVYGIYWDITERVEIFTENDINMSTNSDGTSNHNDIYNVGARYYFI
ncbi:hypothetical protein M9194_12975 [Vibrio sp. S4M6]|uniref:porin n=1 Tax=Vibrio sinus TaxID=2946865 RepID=UPI00202A3B82|nr:hypothetical protein [Vibrio sinus]MCL9782340.1 hypothetical protein [Vibrio sinus]